VPADYALRALSECADQLRQATQVVGQESQIAAAYVGAVSIVERRLRGCFVEVPLEQLRTPRFWAISSLDSVRLIEAVNDERDAQIARLERAAEQLRGVSGRLSSPSTVGVVDTHVLLHYRLFTEIDWRAVMGAEDVLLIVPLRVVDELDEKKGARRDELRERARTVIRHLERALDNAGAVRNHVRVDVIGLAEINPDRYRLPQSPADVEILDTCEAIAAFVGEQRTWLVTGDLGMRIRARERGLRVVGMPEELELAVVGA
jgi:hypothetical protein